jgi:hypothetical protein
MVCEMTNPRGSTLKTDDIDWREARYLARIAEMLLTPRADEPEFKQELESVMSAAEMLSTPIRSSPTDFDHAGPSDRRDRAGCEVEVEGAVLALWRSDPSTVRHQVRPPYDEPVDTRRASCSGTIPMDSTELALAIEEIERAVAALSASDPGSTGVDARLRRRPLRVWLQIAGIWISIGAATTLAMVAVLPVLTR